jgi:hypothetical protein
LTVLELVGDKFDEPDQEIGWEMGTDQWNILHWDASEHFLCNFTVVDLETYL